jgi:hypothetical protein
MVPNRIKTVISYLDLSNALRNSSDLVNMIIQCTIMAILGLALLMTALYCLGILSDNTTTLVVFTIFLRFLQLTSIAICQVVIYNYTCSNCQLLTTITKPLLTVLAILVLFVVSIFIGFYIYPLASSCRFTRINCHSELAQMYCGLLKVIFVNINGLDRTCLLVFAALDCFKLWFVEDLSTQFVRSVNRLLSLITLLTALNILLAMMIQGESQ